MIPFSYTKRNARELIVTPSSTNLYSNKLQYCKDVVIDMLEI